MIGSLNILQASNILLTKFKWTKNILAKMIVQFKKFVSKSAAFWRRGSPIAIWLCASKLYAF